MNLVLTVLEITAPVFLLAAVGFTWMRLGIEYHIRFVTQLTMTLALPALIFTALMQSKIEPATLTTFSLATALAYAVLTLVFWGVVRALGLEVRTYLAPLIYGNTGNLGLPLALFAFGETGLDYAVVIFAVMAVYNFTFGVWLVSGSGSVLTAFKEPLFWGSAFGGVFLWQGWETPTFLTNTLELAGQMAIPLMLITLGVAVARLTPGRLGQAFGLSLLKAALCVAVAWGVGSAFELDTVALAVLILQVATPVAVTSFLLAEKYGADSNAVAGLVVVSTLLSVGLIPLILAWQL